MQQFQPDRDRAKALAEAADQFGTPLYVIDERTLDEAASAVSSAFADGWIRQFSLKANDLPDVVRLLSDRGFGANVVSSGEWDRATSAGVPNSQISLEGIGKTDDDLERVVCEARDGNPIRWIALESVEEARRLAELATAAGLGEAVPPVDVLLRLNPDIDAETLSQLSVGTGSSKFGMEEDEIAAFAQAGLGSAGLRLRGVHVHVGSALREVASWAAAGRRAVRLLAKLADCSPAADMVDFGGGFPIAADGAPGPERFHRALMEALALDGLSLPPTRAIEPGRSLVGASGWLVAQVLHARQRPPYPQQVVLDAGMTELIRPALYGSRHPASALTGNGRETVETAVEGPVCESTDTFGLHQLPRLRRGDLVVIGDAGAYGASCTSRYNGRPEPAEVILRSDGTVQECRREPLLRHPRPRLP